MKQPPKKYVCEKCGYLGDTPEHEGCNYLAWTTGEQLYIDYLEAELAALRASPASAPEGWKHSCNALCLDGVELWIPQCPHCGKPAPTTPSTEDRKVGPREDYFADACRLALELECLLLDCKDTAVTAKWWNSAHEALEQHQERIAAMQEDKP